MFMEGLRVSRAERADYRALDALFLRPVRKPEAIEFDSPSETAAEEQKERHRQYARELVLKCADRNGRILAAIRGQVDEDTLYIKGLAVEPRYQGRGLAALLVYHLEQRSGLKRFVVRTMETNTRHLAVYQAALYKKTGVIDLDRGYKMVCLTKPAAAAG